MKLLFDENLSPRLARLVSAEHSGSSHVDVVGLHGRPDRAIWNHAAQNGFTIVSKDDDFRALSESRGPPPQVVWLDVGNAGTRAIADLLRVSRAKLDRLQSDGKQPLLVLTLQRE